MGNLSTYEIFQQQYPTSTITETQFDATIGVVSTAIETYLDLKRPWPQNCRDCQ